jgi:hypothetical protein
MAKPSKPPPGSPNIKSDDKTIKTIRTEADGLVEEARIMAEHTDERTKAAEERSRKASERFRRLRKREEDNR